MSVKDFMGSMMAMREIESETASDLDQVSSIQSLGSTRAFIRGISGGIEGIFQLRLDFLLKTCYACNVVA